MKSVLDRNSCSSPEVIDSSKHSSKTDLTNAPRSRRHSSIPVLKVRRSSRSNTSFTEPEKQQTISPNTNKNPKEIKHRSNSRSSSKSKINRNSSESIELAADNITEQSKKELSKYNSDLSENNSESDKNSNKNLVKSTPSSSNQEEVNTSRQNSNSTKHKFNLNFKHKKETKIKNIKIGNLLSKNRTKLNEEIEKSVVDKPRRNSDHLGNSRLFKKSDKNKDRNHTSFGFSSSDNFSTSFHNYTEAGSSGLNQSYPSASGHKYPLRSQGKLPEPTEDKKKKIVALGASGSQQVKREDPESSRLTRSGAVLRRSTRASKSMFFFYFPYLQ